MPDIPPDSNHPIPQSPNAHDATQTVRTEPSTRLKHLLANPPATLLLRPSSALTEQHLGWLAFHHGGSPSHDLNSAGETKGPAPGGQGASGGTHTAPLCEGGGSAPPICLLAFKRFDWQPTDPMLLRCLGDVVHWARKQSLPPPTHLHDPLPGPGWAAPAAVQANRASARATPLQSDADDPFAPRAVWVLVRDVATAYVVAVNDRSRQVTLLPCPSILRGIPQGSLDAASTWLPPNWFTLSTLALMRPLRDLEPPAFQLALDFG